MMFTPCPVVATALVEEVCPGLPESTRQLYYCLGLGMGLHTQLSQDEASLDILCGEHP